MKLTARLAFALTSDVLRAIKSNGQADARGRVVVPLPAKRVGKGYRISAGALDAWFAALPDG